MRNNAQSSIEFSIAFVCSIVFVILTCNLFVWMNHCLVGRQVAYENTRVEAGGRNEARVGRSNFYDRQDLNVFRSGGR
jgi:hypothetical protein